MRLKWVRVVVSVAAIVVRTRTSQSWPRNWVELGWGWEAGTKVEATGRASA
jgi:hypothetical protein